MLKSLVHCFHVRAGRRARARRSLSLWFVLGVSTGFFQDLPARAAFGERITVSGTEFRAGTNRIWINGANTPWHVWNEFGGKFNEAWWDHHFELMHENGINASRVWIACDGGGGINIDSNGHVTGCTPKFWADLDALLRIAERHQVYIMATLISFDHFSEGKAHYQGWRKMITNTANIDSMVTNYVVPVVQRYRDDPWLWCVDLCNEPDWISENARCGKISWDWIQTYFARAALGVHTHSRALVTVGIAMGPKYASDTRRTNILSDAALEARAGGDPSAVLDFIATHHYNWMTPAWGDPFYMSPAAYGLRAKKPMIIGECPAKGTAHHSVTEDYESGFENGWQGVMAWSSDGVDGNGSLTNLSPGTRAFMDKHRDLVFPGGNPSNPVLSTNTAPAISQP